MAKPKTIISPPEKAGDAKAPMKAGAAVGVAVVGIGASAGGLEPIGRLLAAMPVDSDLAFVVIQHLDPTSKSMLPELLQRRTAMKVQAASDGIALEPNQVYVIPPGVYLSIGAGMLHLMPRPEGGGVRLPVNVFLDSLATACRERGIGIILSGTGTDGAEGLKTLKDAGGLALAQAPAEAQQDGMPQEAIRVARPDYVVPVQDMPAIISRYVAANYVKVQPPASSPQPPAAASEPALTAVVEAIKARTGQDFGRYKTGTLQRRIERRMALHGIMGWEDYLTLLRRSPPEADALAQDLLINVTKFFRDSEAFAALADQLPDLLRTHQSDQPARIWSAGCSTGEEAYSLGMLFMEQIAAAGQGLGLQIFATDIDDEALQFARAGAYPESIQADVGPERLKQSSSRTTGASGWPRTCARPSFSAGTIFCGIRPSPGWTWSPAATSSST